MTCRINVNASMLLILALVVCLGTGGNPVQASEERALFSVDVEPLNYGGDWLLNGVWHSGAASLELNPGTYSLYIGSYAGLQLTVAEDGKLRVSDPDAVRVDGATLSFQTTELQVDPVDYPGTWKVSGVSATATSGSKSLTLVRSSRYSMEIGGLGARFFFEIDAGGSVTVAGSTAATALGGTLRFNTVEVVIDPGAYTGSWSVLTASHFAKGAAVIPLVADIPMYGLRPGLSSIVFGISADGVVSTSHPAASGGDAQLSLNTMPIAVSPGKFRGKWAIDQTRTREFASGDALVDLPVGMTYQFSAGAWGRFIVDVDALGNVAVRNGLSAVGGPASLRFNTTRVIVDAREYSGMWAIDYIQGWRSGRVSLDLLPLTRYLLDTTDQQRGFFMVEASCDGSYGTHVVNSQTIYLDCNPAKAAESEAVAEPQAEDDASDPVLEPQPQDDASEPVVEPQPQNDTGNPVEIVKSQKGKSKKNKNSKVKKK